MKVEATRVAHRYLQAQLQAQAESAIDHYTDQFLDVMLSKLNITDKTVARLLQTQGISAEQVNTLDDGKQAGDGFIRALGGLVKQGVWYLLVRPFLVLGKVLKSTGFRSEVKREFKKALSHDIRATRHLFSVMGRLANGEEVEAPERKAAFKHLINLIVKAVLIAATVNAGAQGLFSGPIWSTLSRMVAPTQEILIILLNKPIQAATRKLMTVAT
jgi:hypothetical protein